MSGEEMDGVFKVLNVIISCLVGSNSYNWGVLVLVRFHFLAAFYHSIACRLEHTVVSVES